MRTVRRLACAVAIVAVVVLTSCGSSTGGKADTTTTAATVHTPAELGAALLTESDLGGAWTESQRDVFTTRQPDNPSVEDSLSLCPAASTQLDTLRTLSSQAGADVEFQHARTTVQGWFIRQQAWNDVRVPRYLAVLAAGVAACHGQTWNDPDGNSVQALDVTDSTELGDESIMLRSETVVHSADGDVAWRTRLAVARFGNVLMAVGELTVQPASSPSPVSDADWRHLLDVATARFADRLHLNP